MRLWTLHPRYLDSRGLVALWREALLAQAVLRGQTRGYLHHPQLNRFRAASSPIAAIAAYLKGVHAESLRRGYSFDVAKIAPVEDVTDVADVADVELIEATRGQLDYEWQHLLEKLRNRDPVWLAKIQSTARPLPHPLFRLVAGGVAEWEVMPDRNTR